MSDPYIGEIRAVAFDFVPRGWMACNGALLPIAGYSALFALLGTTYGGNGTTTFALPDLRGRSAVGVGTGNGLSPVIQGQSGGTENVSLTTAQLPAHTHAASSNLPGSSEVASTNDPQGAVPAVGRGIELYVPGTGNLTMGPLAITVAPTGGGQPVPLRNPFLGLTYIIAAEGEFPPRS